MALLLIFGHFPGLYIIKVRAREEGPFLGFLALLFAVGVLSPGV